MLRLYGIDATEREVALECYTYVSGTENWYLARALRKRGLKVVFIFADPPFQALPIPSIAGINMGQAANGVLAPGDQQLPTGEFFDSYQFNVAAGQTVHLRLDSSQFDAYLIFTDPSQQQRENDDMTGTNAGLDAYCGGGGTARVIVTSYQAGEQGAYTLQVY